MGGYELSDEELATLRAEAAAVRRLRESKNLTPDHSTGGPYKVPTAPPPLPYGRELLISSAAVEWDVIWSHDEEGEEEHVRHVVANHVPRVGEELWLLDKEGIHDPYVWRVLRVAYWIPPSDHPKPEKQ